MVAPPGLEPRSSGPEPLMLDRYTTGLWIEARPLELRSGCTPNYLFGQVSIQEESRRVFH